MKELFNKVSPVNLVAILAVLAAILIAVSIIPSSEDLEQEDYVRKIQELRMEKDKSFRNSETSPIENKKKFDGLRYFYPDNKYKVEARLEIMKDSMLVEILRSDGKKETFFKHSIAVFELDRKEHKVVLLQNIKDEEYDHLFLPFSDLTAGRETYAGGRYLDVVVPEGDKVTLDFNLAYNPYCVYNYRYSCPLPPKENFIDAQIRAGEKSLKD